MKRLIPLILLLPALAMGAYPDPYNIRIIQSDADGEPVIIDIDGSAHVGKVLGFSGLGVIGPVTVATPVSDGDKGDLTVSGTGSTWTIDAGVITAAKIASGTITTTQISGAAGITMGQLAVDPTNASNLSSGTIPNGRFPATLPAASGVNLTALNASNLGSGTVPDARFPATLPAASGVNLTALNASNLGSGTVPDARFPATLPAASGVNLTALNASNLGSGTVPTARLGTGTANSSTFLRGDGTWNTPSGSGFTTGSFTGTGTYASSNPGTIYPGTMSAAATVTLNLTAGESVEFLVNMTGATLGDRTFSWDDAAQRIGYAGGTITNIAFEDPGWHSILFVHDGVGLRVKDSDSPQLNLTSDVTGTLPVANGGTGITSLGSGVATWLGTPSSANLRSAVSDEAGTGPLMFTRTGVRRTIYVNAGAMIPRTTAGAATATVELATNDVMFDAFDFDQTTEEGVGFWLTLPSAWDAGTVTARFHWTAASGSGTVKWDIAARSFADDDAMDQAMGTEQTASADTLLATGDMHISGTTPALTVGGTPAANRPIYWQVTRDVGGDTLTGDARLLGVTIEYSESTAEPSAQ